MADDVIFQDAVEALRAGNKTKARDLLTGLIKTDQNNVNYWIWLSAAMDSTKERIYCLQTAFKLDPENATAKRGLILLGALPADETIQPFPVNRARAWEAKLLLAHEKPKPKGWAAVKQSPVFRLGIVILLIAGLASGVIFGFVIPRNVRIQRPPTITPGPSPTYTPSPTAIGGKPKPTDSFGTPSGPLSGLLEVPHTPTALYVTGERSPITADYHLQFENAFKAGIWDEAISALQNIIRNDPNAIYAYYYIGEAYRFKNDPNLAVQSYSLALEKNADFGPAYVGLARARLMTEPNANVLPLLDEAIRFDPNFGEAYLERGKVKIRDNDIQGAINDLGDANTHLPDSPLVFHYLAEARLKEGELELALGAAQRAYQLDVTMLESYLLLGQVQAALGNNDEAIKALQVYIKYQSDDIPASMLFGKLLFAIGEYDQTIQMMNRIINLDRTRREAYLYRFLSNVELGKGSAADDDIDAVIAFFEDSFDANLGILRDHVLNERYGSAEQSIDKTETLAQTDEQKALAYYWTGIVFEERENPKKAAEYWQLLLDLPQEAMTSDMRAEAEKHYLTIYTATPSPKPTNTKTATPTKPVTPTRTPTQVPSTPTP
jgi:tetratricopeptide (TPR) repeat protein